MTTPAQATDLLDKTVEILGGDLTNGIPQSGKGLIDQWLNELREVDNAHDITHGLERLKTELESGQPNVAEVEKELLSLADTARQFGPQLGPEGEAATQLEALSAALRQVAGQLTGAGSSK